MRTSSQRWTRLSQILVSLERGVAAASQLDARVPSRGVGPGHDKLLRLNQRIAFLEGFIDHELDVLTSERLDVELKRKRLACTS